MEDYLWYVENDPTNTVTNDFLDELAIFEKLATDQGATIDYGDNVSLEALVALNPNG